MEINQSGLGRIHSPGAGFWPLSGTADLTGDVFMNGDDTTSVYIGQAAPGDFLSVFSVSVLGAAFITGYDIGNGQGQLLIAPSTANIKWQDDVDGTWQFLAQEGQASMSAALGADSTILTFTPTTAQFTIGNDSGGAGDVLSSDGAGNVIWAPAGGGGSGWPLSGSETLTGNVIMDGGGFDFEYDSSGGSINFQANVGDLFLRSNVGDVHIEVAGAGSFIVDINGDLGSTGDVLSSDGAGGVVWAPGGGGASYTFSNGITELAGDVKLGGPVDEGSFNLLSFDAAMFQFGQDNIPSIGSLVVDKAYTQVNISVDQDLDFTGAFGNEFSSYMRGKNATHVYDVEFSEFMYALDDGSVGFLNAVRKRLLTDTSIRDESIFNMIPTQLLFQNTSNAGWVGALQLNGTDGSVLSSTDNPISSRVVVKPDELVLRNEEPVSGQFIENTFQFGQTLTEASDDGIAISTMSFSSGGFSLQFPDGNSSFSGQALGINLSDGANGAALEFGADTLLAQFRVYDGADSSGIAFDITEFAINSPEIKLNAVDGILDFIGLTVAAVGADVPTHTAVISLGGVPYKFFVTPV